MMEKFLIVTKPITRCLFPLFSSDTTLPSILRTLFKKAVLIYKHFCDLFSWFSPFLFLSAKSYQFVAMAACNTLWFSAGFHFYFYL